MNKRKLTAEDRRRMLEVANNAVQFVTRHYVIDLIADLEAAEAEIERLRLDNRCGRHGGYLDEDFCYPCHTENLIKAEAEVEGLVVAVKHIEDMAVPDEFLSDEERLKHIVKLAQAALEDAE
ncbi:hypothetical protein LCGC14_1672470 [marine sediment metagenome]|uniref:Uncharacterized protein n=1 Tax=marine sediment metagenome TaxID=412755 RepID=A0A0F9K6Q5_9ZZZZ